MTPTLTYLGHACFFFETEKAAVLVDPWLSPKGAFLGTWRQLPPNDHCLAWVLKKLDEKPVLVYVTHEHEDHYDEETLKVILPKAAGMVVPKYENEFLLRLIRKNLGITPELLPEDAARTFHDIEYKIFIDESGINRDSAVFLKSGGFSFLDVNDCKIYDRAEWLKEKCGDISVLSVQFSGANMHPICYDMREQDYKNISRQKRMRKFVAVRDFIKDLAPRAYMPSAGPAVFPYAEHEHLNFEENSIFPKWWEFREYLDAKGVDTAFIPLDPLGSIDAAFKTQGLAERVSADKVGEYIAYYRKVDADAAARPLPSHDETLAFFEREMNGKIAVLKNNPKIKFSCPLYMEITQGGQPAVFYRIHPERLVLEKVTRDDIVPPYYHHTGRIDAIGRLMNSGKGWGTYFLSFLFRGRRDPDVFDSALGTFFVANDDGDLDFGLKKLVEFRDSNEYITLQSPEGATVTCKRYCPHQGADLKYASFDGRYVVCPRHQWRFDCENGGKADNSGDTIDASLLPLPVLTGRGSG